MEPLYFDTFPVSEIMGRWAPLLFLGFDRDDLPFETKGNIRGTKSGFKSQRPKAFGLLSLNSGWILKV